MQGARALVEVMRQSGVEHIFGLPGDTGMAFYDALREVSKDITHVMTRDERSASFMADAYARVSGKLGVCEGPSAAVRPTSSRVWRKPRVRRFRCSASPRIRPWASTGVAS